MDWDEKYGSKAIEQTVSDARYMLDNTSRARWATSVIFETHDARAENHFKTFRARLMEAFGNLVVARDEQGLVLSNGRRQMRFDIALRFTSEQSRPINPAARAVRYRSDHANQVHQLMVSVSRHLWLTADNRIRYQRAALKVDLRKIGSTKHRHLVHYLVRDHFSGLFYAELATADHLPSPRDFLLRAWAEKERVAFSGIPDAITVTNTVQTLFPEVMGWLDEVGVEAINPGSGFAAGVRDIKTWEEEIRYALSWYAGSAENDLSNLPALTEYLLARVQKRYIQRWRSSLVHLRHPTAEPGKLHITDQHRVHIDTLYRAYLHRFVPLDE